MSQPLDVCPTCGERDLIAVCNVVVEYAIANEGENDQDWSPREVDDDTYDQIGAAIEILGEHGPGLGRPLVDSIVGHRHKNMKELRPGSAGRSEVRILFAVDPKRRSIMLLAGDKQGAWTKWYRKNVPVADDRYDDHLARLREEKGGQ